MKRPFFDMQGKVVVVTNSADLPGLLMAASMAQAGAAIVLTDPEMKALEIAYEQFSALPSVQLLGVDSALSDEREAAMVVARTLDTFGRLDLWVNNVLPSKREAARLQGEAPEAWRTARRLLDSLIFGTWVAHTQMRHAGRGIIINVFGAREDETAPYFAAVNGLIERMTRYVATHHPSPTVYSLALPYRAVEFLEPDETLLQTLIERLRRLAATDPNASGPVA